jgi:hypothetical protein
MKQASPSGGRDTLEVSGSSVSPAERRLAMYYVGLDVHQCRTSVEILDCNGKLFKRVEVKGRWPMVVEEGCATSSAGRFSDRLA